MLSKLSLFLTAVFYDNSIAMKIVLKTYHLRSSMFSRDTNAWGPLFTARLVPVFKLT